ncbi:MAG: hypothetical protein V1644_01835 [Candidatus Micrarchaeota archaeon]
MHRILQEIHEIMPLRRFRLEHKMDETGGHHMLEVSFSRDVDQKRFTTALSAALEKKKFSIPDSGPKFVVARKGNCEFMIGFPHNGGYSIALYKTKKGKAQPLTARELKLLGKKVKTIIKSTAEYKHAQMRRSDLG